MVNVIGSNGYSGNVRYEGLTEVLANNNAFVHLYGKAQTKPGRKMGHLTLVGNNIDQLVQQAHNAKEILKVVS